MGTRSTNALIIMAGHAAAITTAALKHLSAVSHKFTEQGAVAFTWETNIKPFHARRGVLDLQEDVAILEWVFSLPETDFKLYRHGDDAGTLGQWNDHPRFAAPEIADLIAAFDQVQAIDVDDALVKMLDISTGHIPKHTADALGQPGDSAQPALFMTVSYVPYHEYGWIIAVNEEHAENIRETHPELAQLMQLTLAYGATHLKLDSDGIAIEGLPTFDW